MKYDLFLSSQCEVTMGIAGVIRTTAPWKLERCRAIGFVNETQNVMDRFCITHIRK